MKSKKIGIGVTIFAIFSMLAIVLGIFCNNSYKEKRYFTVR